MVPLLKNKFFSDYFENKGEKTLANYKNVEKMKLQITVHSGSLEITALYKNSFKLVNVFNPKSDVQTMTIDVSQD